MDAGIAIVLQIDALIPFLASKKIMMSYHAINCKVIETIKKCLKAFYPVSINALHSFAIENDIW